MSFVREYVLDAIRSAKSEETLLLKLNSDAMGRAQLAALLAVAIFNSYLLGRAQVYADVRAQGTGVSIQVSGLTPDTRHLKPDVLAAALVDVGLGFEPLPFDEAIDYFRNKVPVSPERFRALSIAARKKAFTVADGANRQVRDHIKQLLDHSLSEGLTLKDFQEGAADVLDNAGIAPREPWYWETVYRTNMQTSYQAGRWQQMTDPEVVSERPYIRYVSALLPTTRPSHREKHGLIYPADDPFWSTWYPPNGFNCYCSAQSISESLLKRRGWTVSEQRSFQYPEPDSGFATNAGRTEAI